MSNKNRRHNFTLMLTPQERSLLNDWAEKYDLPISKLIRAPWAMAVKDRNYRWWFEYFFRYMRPGSEDAKFPSWEEYFNDGERGLVANNAKAGRRQNFNVRLSPEERAFLDGWAERYGLPVGTLIRAPWAMAVKDKNYRFWFEYFFRYMRPGEEDAKHKRWEDYGIDKSNKPWDKATQSNTRWRV